MDEERDDGVTEDVELELEGDVADCGPLLEGAGATEEAEDGAEGESEEEEKAVDECGAMHEPVAVQPEETDEVEADEGEAEEDEDEELVLSSSGVVSVPQLSSMEAE